MLILSLLSHIAIVSAFVHPGVYLSQPQLDFIKLQVQNKVEPMYSAFLQATTSTWGVKTYTPAGPPASGIIDCGSYSNPDFGCSEEDDDATAALTQILLYHLTDEPEYASNVLAIMNSYAYNLVGYNNTNSPLQAAWAATKFARAAELLLHSNANWPKADLDAFIGMVRTINLPLIDHGSDANGNWEISMVSGMLGYSIFLDDQELYNKGLNYWQTRTAEYYYSFKYDGNAPRKSPGAVTWYNQTVFNASVTGIAQETCRDFGHLSYSLADTMNAAETLFLQGDNVYQLANVSDRLVNALEFHANLMEGAPVPDYVCGGSVKMHQAPTFEIGYTAFAHRLGFNMPNTLKHLKNTVRALNPLVDVHMMVYETLTHSMWYE
jgi:Alginate lyase